MNVLRVLPVIAMLSVLPACDMHLKGEEEAANAVVAEAAVMSVLSTQQDAWNRGDIPGFMEGYWKSDELRFASGGAITYGWQKTLETYQANYGIGDPERMGQLMFSDLVFDITGPNDALVFGKWQLTLGETSPWGLFTLHFSKIDGKWLIVSDHTSSAGR